MDMVMDGTIAGMVLGLGPGHHGQTARGGKTTNGRMTRGRAVLVGRMTQVRARAARRNGPKQASQLRAGGC